MPTSCAMLPQRRVKIKEGNIPLCFDSQIFKQNSAATALEKTYLLHIQLRQLKQKIKTYLSSLSLRQTHLSPRTHSLSDKTSLSLSRISYSISLVYLSSEYSPSRSFISFSHLIPISLISRSSNLQKFGKGGWFDDFIEGALLFFSRSFNLVEL